MLTNTFLYTILKERVMQTLVYLTQKPFYHFYKQFIVTDSSVHVWLDKIGQLEPFSH